MYYEKCHRVPQFKHPSAKNLLAPYNDLTSMRLEKRLFNMWKQRFGIYFLPQSLRITYISYNSANIASFVLCGALTARHCKDAFS